VIEPETVLEQEALARECEALRRRNAELAGDLAAAKASLAAARQDVQQLIHAASHDLRAPLRALQGLVKILQEDHAEGLPPETTRILGRIVEASRRLNSLIDGMLAYHRMMTCACVPALVDVAPIVTRAIHTAARREQAVAPPGDREVATGDLGRAEADAALLERVFEELVGNAFKFTRRAAAPRIEIGSRPESGTRAWYVRDNGAGFDPQWAQAIFTPFHRMHALEDYEGGGFGLAVTRRIVERHGGRIWFEASVDGGATFYFTLGEGPAHD